MPQGASYPTITATRTVHGPAKDVNISVDPTSMVFDFNCVQDPPSSSQDKHGFATLGDYRATTEDSLVESMGSSLGAESMDALGAESMVTESMVTKSMGTESMGAESMGAESMGAERMGSARGAHQHSEGQKRKRPLPLTTP